ncbi:MAG: GlxA family transcriptional regulator [Sphingobium sp.]
MSQNDISLPMGDIPAGPMRPTRLAYLLIDGFALMSYAPVVEPFRAANRLSGRSLYEWRHYSVSGAPAHASNGLSVSVDGGVDMMEPADILFLCAGGNPALFQDSRTFDVLRRTARFGTVMGGVSGGPFILARAGLLDGFRCTIHWEHEQAFKETFARPRLERGLFVVDNKRVTCAGGLAGLDLSAMLIAQTHGSALAGKVSDWYIQTEQRQASRPQRQSPAQRYRVSHEGLVATLSAMEDNVEEPLRRAALASAAGLSVRQLERLFRLHLGTSIGGHYLTLRLEKARRLLTETAISVTDAGVACGFASAGHFSRIFKQHYAVSPSAMRKGDLSWRIADRRN